MFTLRNNAKQFFYRLQHCISYLIYPYLRIKEQVRPKGCARILMYHSITDFPPERGIPYDNVPPWLFEHQMSILVKENYNMITMDSLVEIIKNGNEIPTRTIVLTFDDGFKNNFIYAFPILKRRGLKATFFFIADSIGKKEPFKHLLWDDASIKYCSEHPESRLPMDLDEIKELKSYGMEIGSHGLTHRSVGNLDPEQAKSEIFGSKKILEDAINDSVRFFSYPFGSKAYNDFNIFTLKVLEDAGYEAACTAEIGAIFGRDNVYELRRIPIREGDNDSLFRQKLVGAYDWVNMFKWMFQLHVDRTDKAL